MVPEIQGHLLVQILIDQARSVVNVVSLDLGDWFRLYLKGRSQRLRQHGWFTDIAKMWRDSTQP